MVENSFLVNVLFFCFKALSFFSFAAFCSCSLGFLTGAFINIAETCFRFLSLFIHCFLGLAFLKGLTSSRDGKRKGLGVAPGIPFQSGKFSFFKIDGKAVDL